MKPPREYTHRPAPARKPLRDNKPVHSDRNMRDDSALPTSGWSPSTSEAGRAPEGRTDRPARARPDREWSRPATESVSGDQPRSRGKDAWKLKSPRKKFRIAGKEGSRKEGSREREAEAEEGLNILYGIHTVSAALRNPRRKFKRLLATENGALRLAEDGPLPLEATIVSPDVISKRLTPDAVHQGVLLEAEELAPLALHKIPDDAVVLALDQVTDPHNVGAILRSCAAFNVSALIITERHSPEVTGVLAKAASGALEHVPFATVRNLSVALETLKSRGFMCVGLDSDAPAPISEAQMQRPVIIVMGAEGKGLRQKTRETCTDLVRLDMPGAIRSLNVSNAAAIALYAVTTGLKG